ncbi:choice-of-anchor E domain-containing protein [Nocardioides sp. WS12]|uniref:choice-of-anchor E domain-containing protein n=1 Tax=Nocardioides sp. WS12 TaxID=2486272 RepID=UPI0015FA2551|nr:choice-of-anchor E domain-containing protein [Nocardioides sp. WS12]
MHEGSVAIESFPSDKVINVPKFDDEEGLLTLTEVTVIASVDGELEGSVENLSASQPKSLSGSLNAAITVNGVGVSNLEAAGSEDKVWNLAPGEIQPITLLGAGVSSEVTVTEPAVLAGFVGEGDLNYDVHSEIDVSITGPAPYKTTGVAGGEAKVKISYTFADTCVVDPENEICAPAEPDCATEGVSVTKIAPVMNEDKKVFDLNGGGTFTMFQLDLSNPIGETFDWTSTVNVFEIQVKGGPGFEPYLYPGGSMEGNDLHAPLQASQDTWHSVNYILVCSEPVPDCESDPEMEGCSPPDCLESDSFKIDPVSAGDHALPGGGTFTIVKHDSEELGETFDWTSDVPIFWISVKGGPQAIPQEFYDYQPQGALSDEGLHAPDNPNSGKYYGLSHLTVCAGDSEPTCEDQPDMDGCDEPTCEDDPNMEGCDEPTCEDDPNMEGCDPASNQCDTVEGFKIDPVTEGEHGVFTITDIYNTEAGQVFDWESTVPILAITVKGGPVANDPQFYSYAPDGALSGTGLHAILNPNSGKWYGLSHLCVKADEPEGPAGLTSKNPGKDQKESKEQPAAKVDPVPAPKQEEGEGDVDPEPEPAPEPAPEPEPQVEETPPPPAEPASAPEPEPTPEPAAGDAPAGE